MSRRTAKIAWRFHGEVSNFSLRWSFALPEKEMMVHFVLAADNSDDIRIAAERREPVDLGWRHYHHIPMFKHPVVYDLEVCMSFSHAIVCALRYRVT